MRISIFFYFILHVFIGLPVSIISAFIDFVFYGKYVAEMEISDWIEKCVVIFGEI